MKCLQIRNCHLSFIENIFFFLNQRTALLTVISTYSRRHNCPVKRKCLTGNMHLERRTERSSIQESQ